jgi:ATP-dependent Lhr-like helicase
MRWLLDWHHLAPQTQLTGEEGVLAALEQLEGFEAPAVEWERKLLPARVADYDPQWLDNLCLAGIVGWGRISPHPAWQQGVAAGAGPRRVIPTTAAPITFYLRESAEWLPHALAAKCVDEVVLAQTLSAEAQRIRALLAEHGAAFTADLQRVSGMTKLQTTTALWELATAGLASADGFDPLRAMMDPRRKSVAVEQTPAVSLRKRAAARTTTGRWSLFGMCADAEASLRTNPQAAIENARRTDAALDAHARVLLCRYGVLFRELLARESNAPKWRDLLPILRRLEARGEIRGGRFVSGAFGEQYALPEVVESLRAARSAATSRADEPSIAVGAADPLNLAGILVPGERVAAVPGREVLFVNGAVQQDQTAEPPRPVRPARTHSIPAMLRQQAIAVRTATPPVHPGLFS